jgi:hypothetical protein
MNCRRCGGPDPQLFSLCLACIAEAPKVNPQAAWGHVLESKRANSLALVGRYETTEEGWRVIEDLPVETMEMQEAKYE